MPPGSPSSRGIRGFIKRSVGNVKEALGSRARTPDPHTPSPQHQPSPGVPSVQLTPAPEHPSPPPARSQQPTPLSQPALSPGRPASTTSLVTTGSVRSADGVSTLAQVGEDVWTGLKGALQLLERSSDAFPPLKSAVAGFLGVVNVFEASDFALHAMSWRLFCFGTDCRQEPERLRGARVKPARYGPGVLQSTRGAIVIPDAGSSERHGEVSHAPPPLSHVI